MGDLYKLSQEGNGEGLFHRKFYQFGKRPKKLHPTQWLMEVLMEPDVADRRFVFRIDHPELLSELQLEKVGVDKSGLRFYTFEQMQPHVMLLHRKKQVIGEKDASPVLRTNVLHSSWLMPWNYISSSATACSLTFLP